MEFTQYTCPVCDKRFENGDDVVVCPECGSYVLGSRATCKNCGYAFGEVLDRGYAPAKMSVG